jgi:hypothetical protein
MADTLTDLFKARIFLFSFFHFSALLSCSIFLPLFSFPHFSTFPIPASSLNFFTSPSYSGVQSFAFFLFFFYFFPGVPISSARTLFFIFPLLLWRVLPTTLSIYSPSHVLVETSRSSNFIGSFTSR